jgi:lipopolysaccharide cholinephosphotransferase
MGNSNRDLQIKLLGLMKIFHNVCERNNIQYFMLGGTMLGAVRHKGFIPWDDDMDVGLPRKDYEKILSLHKNEWSEHIYIKTPMNSKDLIFPYAKIMDKNTTLVEDCLDGIVGGIFIDVFPLDGAGNSILSAKISYYRSYWQQGLLYYNQNNSTEKITLKRLFQFYAKRHNLMKLYKRTIKWMTKVDYYQSQIIGNYSGSWGIKEFIPRIYMGTPTLYEFEDTKFFGPENPDAYLKSLYGDYMKLPPLDKRISHHNFKYIDLQTPFSKYQSNLTNSNI